MPFLSFCHPLTRIRGIKKSGMLSGMYFEGEDAYEKITKSYD